MSLTHCAKCNTRFSFFGNSSNAGNGLCVRCDGERYQKAILAEAESRSEVKDDAAIKRKALAEILVTTEPLLLDIDIVARLGIIGADVAFGAGPLKDIAVSFSNAFGGRSDTMGQLMQATRSTALEELRKAALEIGANAVIGVSFTVTSIGTNGTMTLMCATGTAVTVQARAPAASGA